MGLMHGVSRVAPSYGSVDGSVVVSDEVSVFLYIGYVMNTMV